LIAVALMSGGMLAWPVITGGGGPGTVTAAGAVQLINREKAVVVDVCEAGEYASGHVAGAKPRAAGRAGAEAARGWSRTRPRR
jgi:hypothetical protein